MNQGRPHIIIAFICALLLTLAGRAQNPVVSVKADHDKILIGEPVILTLDASFPPGSPEAWFNTDSIPHFEFIRKGKIDTIKGNANAEYTQQVTITSFDSGQWTIPAFIIEINGRQYLTDSLSVTVAYSPMDPKTEYHDIHEIVEVDNPDTRYLTWITAGILVLSLLGLAYFLSRKMEFRIEKEAEITQPAPHVPALEEAMQQLSLLEKEQLAQSNIKLYFTRLNDILRNFLLRKNILVTGKTNAEIMLKLQQARLHRDELTPLMQTLRMTDAVKFAKFIPSTAENQDSFTIIKNSIQSFDRTLKS